MHPEQGFACNMATPDTMWIIGHDSDLRRGLCVEGKDGQDNVSVELTGKPKAFFDHWASLRTEGSVPTLRDFLDRPSPEFQPYVAIYDVCDDGQRLPLRLFGTGLVDFMGSEITGKDFLMSAEPDLRPIISFTAKMQVEHPCGRTDLRKVASSKGAYVETDALSLPLLTEGDRAPSIVLYLNHRETMGHGETLGSVLSIEGIRWVNVGAGVPDVDPPGSTASV